MTMMQMVQGAARHDPPSVSYDLTLLGRSVLTSVDPLPSYIYSYRDIHTPLALQLHHMHA